MTVKELKRFIEQYDEKMEIEVCRDYTYAKAKEVYLCDDEYNHTYVVIGDGR